ncbi:MAG TPA: DUF5343 domain-containing protein [Terriglobales bacterium]|nr:DUF5343 domain-containing protein [Terriglobales bacterium]
MAEKHPYASPGSISATIVQLRKAFPPKVTADTLKKLGIAPQNESYIINVLRFIGAIDAESNKTEASTAAFSKHNDDEFQKAFEAMIKPAYSELFSLHAEGAWNLSTDDLISFFRNSDQTSDVVGRRQASTFQALAALAGHGEPAAPKGAGKPRESKPKAARTKAAKVPNGAPVVAAVQPNHGNGTQGMALTVRVEVNLPAGGDQETYDRIFRSIRENLLNAK